MASGCTIVIVMIVTELVSFAICGFVLASTWNWFVASSLKLNELTWLEGVGLSFFISAVQSAAGESTTTKAMKSVQGGFDGTDAALTKAVSDRFGDRIVAPLFVLFWAWLFHVYILGAPPP